MIVIKIGTSVIGKRVLESLLKEIRVIGEPIILVHGCSRRANELSLKRKKPPRFYTLVDGGASRYVDAEDLGIFTEAAKEINLEIVNKAFALNLYPVRICCPREDRGIVAKRHPHLFVVENNKKKVLHNNFTGRPWAIDFRLFTALTNKGLLPVVAPLALSINEEVVAVDADRVAALIATSFPADKLIFFFDEPGLLEDPADKNSALKELSLIEAKKRIQCLQGGIRRKIEAGISACEEGVSLVKIAPLVEEENPIRKTLSSGSGTRIYSDPFT